MATSVDRAACDLLRAARGISVEELPTLIARAARNQGLGDCVVYVTDYEQRKLLPLPGPSVPVRAPIEIRATLAGQAFQTSQLTVDNRADGPYLWAPISGGTERWGVLGVGASDTSDNRLRCDALADAAFLLLVSKSRSGDYLDRMRRRQRVSLAAEMQWGLLPPLSFGSEHISISGALEPSYEIAGDSFDYAVDSGTARVAIFDAIGHGLEAAGMAMLAVGAYRHVRREGGDLESIRTLVDDVIGERYAAEKFVTGQFADLDGRTGRMRWLNAGHPRPLLIRQNKVVGRLDCEPTLPLGLGGDVGEIADVDLQSGDRVLFVTDGVTEARSPAGTFFGDDRLDKFVASAQQHDLGVPETLRRLVHALIDYQSGALQDDATMMMVEWRGSQEAVELPS